MPFFHRRAARRPFQDSVGRFAPGDTGGTGFSTNTACKWAGRFPHVENSVKKVQNSSLKAFLRCGIQTCRQIPSRVFPPALPLRDRGLLQRPCSRPIRVWRACGRRRQTYNPNIFPRLSGQACTQFPLAERGCVRCLNCFGNCHQRLSSIFLCPSAASFTCHRAVVRYLCVLFIY